MKAFKVTNKVTAGFRFVEAEDLDGAWKAFAALFNKDSVEQMKDSFFQTPLSKNVFAVSVGYFKSDAVRGRFPSKQKATEACIAKGIDPRTVGWYFEKTVHC